MIFSQSRPPVPLTLRVKKAERQSANPGKIRDNDLGAASPT